MDKSIKKPFHEQVAENLIKLLEAGTAPWQIPWKAGEPNAMMPINATNGKRYKGINAINLMAQGRSDSRWLTYNQASAMGAQVRKGERSTTVQYWKFNEEKDKLDANGKPELDERGQKKKIIVKLERPKVFYASVFNAEQVDGMPPVAVKKVAEQTWDASERAESILAASGANINHVNGDRAFYSVVKDSITLPERSQFESADAYYATALHELGHWTGHSTRLDRDLSNPFGSEGYAKEELRAEISSMIMGDELGIGHDPSQHASYVESWIKVLKDDPMEIFRAAADAEKINSFVLGLEQEQVQEQKNENLLSAFTPEIVKAIEDTAQARSQYKAGKISEADLTQVTKNSFGVELPTDWSGELRIVGVIEKDGIPVLAEMGEEAQGYQIYARKAEAVFGDDPFAFVKTVATESEAAEFGEQLKLAQALSETDEAVRDAKLALVHEERLRRDPESTEEQVLAAKSARKNAEFTPTEAKLVEELSAEAQQSIPAEAQQSQQLSSEKTYINVPFSEKEEAKDLGARWDRAEKSWYVPAGVDVEQFSKWNSPTQQQPEPEQVKQPEPEQVKQQARQYLAVPYEERGAAKAAGAKWDRAAKSWYAGEGADLEKLAKWELGKAAEQSPAMTPVEEFSNFLRAHDFIIEDGHPIMDGKSHRISVEGDKNGEKSGFYVGHSDGHPAGYMKNNRTGEEDRWKSKGYTLNPEARAELQAVAAQKLADRAQAQEATQLATAARLEKQANGLSQVADTTAYLKSKGVKAHKGVLTDKAGLNTYIPATDADGKQWTTQYIQEDGTKRFAKDSRKEGCFHAVGGMEAVAAAPVLVIAEGYATAASVAEALGQATVAAFDSGNLEAVAKSLKEKYPDKPIVIAGDDDAALALTHGVNAGREKATEAALAVGGKAIFPVFAAGENSYPADLPIVTPALYKAHAQAVRKLDAASENKIQLSDTEKSKLTDNLLSSEQLAAIAAMKKHTDFNDLSEKSALGKEGLVRQVTAIVAKVASQSEQTNVRAEKVVKERAKKQEQVDAKRPEKRKAVKI